MVRVRIELTTLALSAPRSAYWANGPLVPMKGRYIDYDQEFIMATRGFEDMKICFGLCPALKHRAARGNTTGYHEVKAELFH